MTTRRSILTLAALAPFAPLRVARAETDCRGDATAATLLDRYVQAVNAHDTSSFADLFPEDYIQHSGRSPSGLAAQVENWKRNFAVMPDVSMQVEDRIIAGDKIVARNAFSATHTRPLPGIAPDIPPSGRRFVIRTIDIWRVVDAKLAEHWDVVDIAGVIKQLRGAG
jgi:predicted ester cyclase